MQTPHPLLELFRFTPARPAIAAGLRAGVAACLPLFAAPWIPLDVVSWISLGAYQAALADKGGAYRTRAVDMATRFALSSAACLIGSLVGGASPLLLPLAFVLLLICGLAQVASSAVSASAVTFAVTFVIAAARPQVELPEAVLFAASVAAGGLTTMFLSLILWPVRLYRPARLTIARCYDGLREHAEMLRSTQIDEQSELALHAHRADLRNSIEEARRVLTATRRGRQGESERGERLVVLLENVDQLLGVAIALEAVVATARPVDRTRIAAALSVVETSAEAIAERLRTEAEVPGHVPRLENHEGPGAVGTLLGRLRRHLEAAAESAEGLNSGRPVQHPVTSLAPPAPRQRPIGERLRETLDLDSVVLRHALRLAIAGTVAAAVALRTRDEHGYWITLTTIVILQPWTTATFQRGLQRMLGTTIGAGIAVAAIGLVDQRFVFIAIVFVFCTASVALLPINYGLFSVLLTPTFVLIAEVGTGDFGLAWVRMVDTLIGGAIALVAARLLWPSWERHRFPEELSLALHLSAGWIREMGRAGPHATASEIARRQTGIAVSNAEASLQRLLSEVWTRAEDLEPLLALTVYLRRMHANALVFFSEADEELRGAVVGDLAGFLDKLAGCVATARPPGPSSEMARLEALADRVSAEQMRAHAVREGLARLARQVAILHGAATRGFSSDLLKGR